MINELYRAAELNVHITVDADQAAFVFRLAPFETDDDFFIDPVVTRLLAESQSNLGETVLVLKLCGGVVCVQVLQHGSRVDGHNL